MSIGNTFHSILLDMWSNERLQQSMLQQFLWFIVTNHNLDLKCETRCSHVQAKLFAAHGRLRFVSFVHISSHSKGVLKVGYHKDELDCSKHVLWLLQLRLLQFCIVRTYHVLLQRIKNNETSLNVVLPLFSIIQKKTYIVQLNTTI